MPRGYRVIVIGSGIAGLFVALEARRLGPVLVLTKGSIDDCNTRWAQGGIAAAVGALDSAEQHYRDTIAAGAGLVDEEAARVLTTEAPGRIRDLIAYGVAFDEVGGEVALGREAAHSASRILHAGGDRTGAAIETALSGAARLPGITILDHTIVTRLVVERGAITGVEAVDLASGGVEAFEAPAVVLATGGAGQLFSHTTNPEVATGDGVALAYDAGAEIGDIEFYQFHPTALRLRGGPPFLISEAVRGEGAVLRNAGGEAFMPRYHELADLAPRDVVARAITAEMHAAGSDHAWLDCTALHIDLPARFPGIFQHCMAADIDIRKEPIPVAPAAHYMMGGVRTDIWGRTNVEGLFAVGEVACTGVHGANRLASNSLMETVVFGKRVVEHLAADGWADYRPREAEAIALAGGPAPSHAELQRLMWRCAGIERAGGPGEASMGAGLAAATAWPDAPPELTREAIERRQMATVARLMLHAALQRTESRGAHYRRDYPEIDDIHWKRRQVFRYAD
ncbi:MAG: L-aspartate oxidase [Dehalococcoidia bacterium]|nr:L-aspartate oxidase [Dehalococcoidia bacterium]